MPREAWETVRASAQRQLHAPQPIIVTMTERCLIRDLLYAEAARLEEDARRSPRRRMPLVYRGADEVRAIADKFAEPSVIEVPE